MKSFRFLSIILCTIIGISTYDANGMNNIKNNAKNLSAINIEADSVADGYSVGVAKLCSTIEKAEDNGVGGLIISENDLRDIKEQLLKDAEFYFRQAKDNEYCSDRQTMSYMTHIFGKANELITTLSPDNDFQNRMNFYINKIKQIYDFI